MFSTLSSHDVVVFLLQVGVLLGTALLLGKLAAAIGMPKVAGELCAGVILGPSLLVRLAPGARGWLIPGPPAQSHLIDAVGQTGVLLLVGMSGAQVDLGLVRRQARTVARVGVAGLIVPLVFGVGVGLLLPASLIGSDGRRGTFAFFMGVAMAVSAIPVIAKTLHDMKLLHRDIGQLTLAASLVDDAAGWCLLSAVSAFVTVRAGQRAGHIVLVLSCLLGVIVVAALAGRPLGRLFMSWLDRSADPAVTVAAIAALILLSAAGAGALGLEPVFGAFVCGLVIGPADVSSRARLAPLNTVVMGFLAPVFFATAGLRMNLGALGSPPVLASAAAILLLAVTGKFAGAYAGARLSGLGGWEAIALSGGLNARGVIQIVIASVGLRINVLTAGSYTIIVLVAIATSMMAAPVLRTAMRRIDRTEEEDLRAESLIIPA